MIFEYFLPCLVFKKQSPGKNKMTDLWSIGPHPPSLVPDHQACLKLSQLIHYLCLNAECREFIRRGFQHTLNVNQSLFW